MAGGEWERLASKVIIPALKEAAAELNERDDIVAEYTEDPIEDACILWIARRLSPSPFLTPQGSFVVHDEPAVPMIRVEEAAPRVSGGKPIVTIRLRQTSLSARAIKTRALSFAERVLSTSAEPVDQQA